MDELGIPLTEAGSFSPAEAFPERGEGPGNKLVAFGMTRRRVFPGGRTLRALAESDVSVVSLVGKADAAQTAVLVSRGRKPLHDTGLCTNACQSREKGHIRYTTDFIMTAVCYGPPFRAEEADTLCPCDTKAEDFPRKSEEPLPL